MDKAGEQLRYSNRIVNSVTLKNDTRIGFCDMYQNNNRCLCMSVNRKNSEFNSFGECNGMCTKQNINIYIDNFDANRSDGNYDSKCKAVNDNNYSFYETAEQNSSNGNAFYSDVAWLEPNDKRNYTRQNASPNYYPYSRRCLPEPLPFVRNQIENKSTAHVNLPQVVDTPSNRDKRTYIFPEIMDKDQPVFNGLHSKKGPCNTSANTTSSSCSNLYVEPPYFTVDKFVNEENTVIRSAPQNTQFYNGNVFHYQRMTNNFEQNSLKTSEVKHQSVHDQEIIGIKLVDNPDIPHMHFESSIKPVNLGIMRRNRYLPIKKEKCNYENDFKLDSNFKTETNAREKSSYTHEFNKFPSKNSPVFQCNSTDIPNLENNLSHEVVGLCSAYNNFRNRDEMQFSHCRRNLKTELYSKSSSSSIIIPPSKNLVREIRKPNYRELINNAHALRNATSEDDLNMQIIKRTLNYNQKSKDISTCNLMPLQFSSNEAANTNKLFTPDSNCIEKPVNPNKHHNFFNDLTSHTSPLDLSVKTVKSNADSTANDPCCKVLISENGYPPKFNFKPDFSENCRMSDDRSVNAKEDDCYKFGLSRSSIEATQTNRILDSPSYITDCCNQSRNNVNLIGCRSKSDILFQASIPNFKSNFVCNFQNCVPVSKCMNEDVGPGNSFKVEVTLKRSAHFKSDIEAEFEKKRICIKSDSHSEIDSTNSPKSLDTMLDKLSNNQNLQITNSVGELQKDNSNSTLEYIANTSGNELTHSNAEVKQDDYSVNAARIRTKAELKGFTFHEDKDIYFNELLSNKENCHCNDRSNPLSQEEDTVDLIQWKNACNRFVDQLIQGCTDNHDNKKQNHSENKKHVSEINKIVIDKETNYSPDRKCTFPTDGLFASIINNTSLAKAEIISASECNHVGTKSDEISKLKTESTGINQMKSDCIEPIYAVGCKVKSYDIYIPENEKKDGNEHINNIIPCLEECNKKYFVNTMTNIHGEEEKNDINKNTFLQNNAKVIDLKKISVVRLKRENYESKNYNQYNKDFEKTKTDLGYNCVNNIGKNLAIKKKISSIREENTLTKNRRQLRHVKSKDNVDSKSSTITTRLRHHMSQSNSKSELKKKNNKTQKSEKSMNKLRRHKNKKDSEATHDLDKLYLEVYRYKRALKVPPNLITIKNSYKQGISSSLPDLDVDMQSSSAQNEAINNNEFKVEEGPKSIIDVLHSRIIKTKNHLKNNLRHTKTENQQTKIGQCTNQSVHFKKLTSHENENCSNREYRNVFETQILASRTRTEYKMQLNKEVIREIFGGNERPASAPPEINNMKNDIKLVFEQHYNKYSNNNNTSMHGLGEQQQQYDPSQINLRGEKGEEKNSTNKNDQSGMTIKYKQKRCGRSYRRKFSSGFDYLRKKKKSKTRTLYKYTQLKSRVENYIAEPTQYSKNEGDVSREIQKWVLNKSVGQSALHKAARLGYIDVIVYCLERMGLNPNHKDNAGYTPLHDACVKGSLEIARVLLQYGANHSEGAHSGIRPLHEASENGHIEVVRMLLSYGADPLLETYSGQTPLMLASENRMSDLLSKHLIDIQMNEVGRQAWRFPGPWKILDDLESGYDSFSDIRNLDGDRLCFKNRKYYLNAQYAQDMKNRFVGNVITELNSSKKYNSGQRNDVCEFEILVDTSDAEGELFEFEEANMPLPPLYMLKDEGMEKWVLLSDLCSLLKVKSKDTLLHKIFPSISPTTVSRVFIRELKMCDFLEKATCLQLLCAGEKINICHSKVVLVQYNENVRKLLGVKTILMKF